MGKTFGLSWILAGILLTSCVPPRKVSFYPLIFRSQQYLKAGNFQEAIDTCQATHEKYPEAKPVLDNYVKILLEIKNSAERFFETKDYPSAISIYVLLAKNWPRIQKIEKSLPFSHEWLNVRLRDSKNRVSEAQARQALEAADSDKAVEIYKARYLENPDDAEWLGSFVALLEEIKRVGDGAWSKENFVAAGRAYASLSKNFKSFDKFQASLSFSEKSLDEGIKNCRTELNKKALELYRKEKLGEAISIWQDILIFDPENLETKKAVETATLQLKKIKKANAEGPTSHRQESSLS
jgi:tetratricopeptide (TPR) repeat protein